LTGGKTDFKMVVGLFTGILLLIVFFQNTQVVSLKLLFWDISMSRVIWLILFTLIGFVIGVTAGRKRWF